MKKLIVLLLMLGLSSFAALAIDQSLLLKLLELKRISYLAKRGELNFDLVPSYNQDSSVVPWSITKNTTTAVDLGLRLGLSSKVEAGVKIPYNTINRKVYASGWESQRGAGFGDPSFSLQLEFLPETYNRPAAYLNLGATLPMAKSSFDVLPAGEIATGNGYFSFNSGISLLKSIDPVVVYGGVGYQMNLRRGNYSAGNSINYNAGLGWSLNESANLSLGISGGIVGEDKQIIGGAEQPVSTGYNHTALSLGSTFIMSRDLFVTPTVSVGLTDEETDFVFSFGVTTKLREAL